MGDRPGRLFLTFEAATNPGNASRAGARPAAAQLNIPSTIFENGSILGSAGMTRPASDEPGSPNANWAISDGAGVSNLHLGTVKGV